MINMSLLGLSIKNTAGQIAVAKSSEVELKIALSASGFLSVEAANIMIMDKDVNVRRRSTRRSDLSERLEQLARRSELGVAPAARNPHTPVTVLKSLATGQDCAGKLGALSNVSLDEDIRRSMLTPDTAEKLCENGSISAEWAIRGTELVIANPWMKENTKVWGKAVKRGLVSMYDISQQQLIGAQTTGNKRWTKGHPSFEGGFALSGSVANIAKYGLPSCDFFLSESDKCTLPLAQYLMGRTLPPVESFVLARLAERFGVPVIACIGNLSSTRIFAAAHFAPSLNYYYHLFWGRRAYNLVEANEYSEACEEVGEDAEAWGMIARMAAGWNGSIGDLTSTCKAIK